MYSDSIDKASTRPKDPDDDQLRIYLPDPGTDTVHTNNVLELLHNESEQQNIHPRASLLNCPTPRAALPNLRPAALGYVF